MKNLARFYCILIADKCKKRLFIINFFKAKKEPTNAKNIANRQALFPMTIYCKKGN